VSAARAGKASRAAKPDGTASGSASRPANSNEHFNSNAISHANDEVGGQMSSSKGGAGSKPGELDNRELIAFRVGRQEFCINVMMVREIRGWTVATALPRAPRYIRGVINLRGSVLPIVDLAVRLGLPSSEPTARNVIIVVQIAQQQIGLLVDAVSDILTVSEREIQPTPDIASDLVKTFVRGLLPVDGRMISLISLDQVLPADEREAA
jgi:purine-binding chemotaxis protein CheW